MESGLARSGSPRDSLDATAVRRILLNAGSLVGAYAAPRAFTILSVVVAAQVLGPGTFGAYGTAAAFAVILSILATLGLMPLLVRELTRAPGRAAALLASAHFIKLGSGAVMMLALYGLGRGVMAYPEPVLHAALLLGAGYAVGSLSENLGAFFQSVERMHVWMQASALFGLVSGGVGVLLILTTGSIVWFCAAPLVGHAAGLAWLASRMPPELRALRRPDPADARRLALALVPFAAAFVALAAFYKADVLVLARLRPESDVGVYVAAYKFIDVFQALALAAIVAVYPRLVRRAPAAARGERWIAGRVAELGLLAAVPGAGVLWLLRGEAVALAFGAAYASAVPVLALLAAAIPALALNLLAGYVLGATHRMGTVAAAYAAALLVKLGLNAALVPAHGAGGAAAAMLASEWLLAAGLLVALRAAAAAAPAGRILAAAAVAAGACVAVAMLPSPFSHGPVAAVIFAAAALGVYWRAGVLPAREWSMLRRAVRP